MIEHSSGSYHCEKCSPKHFSHLFECSRTLRGAMLFNFLTPILSWKALYFKIYLPINVIYPPIYIITSLSYYNDPILSNGSRINLAFA